MHIVPSSGHSKFSLKIPIQLVCTEDPVFLHIIYLRTTERHKQHGIPCHKLIISCPHSRCGQKNPRVPRRDGDPIPVRPPTSDCPQTPTLILSSRRTRSLASIILIIGRTGAGKSSRLEYLTGSIGHSEQSVDSGEPLFVEATPMLSNAYEEVTNR